MTEVENEAPEVSPESDTSAEQAAATEDAKEEQPAEAKTNGEKCKKKSSGFKGWMKNLANHVKTSTKGDKKVKSEAVANGKEEKADEKREEDEASKADSKPEEHKDGEQSQPQEEVKQE